MVEESIKEEEAVSKSLTAVVAVAAMSQTTGLPQRPRWQGKVSDPSIPHCSEKKPRKPEQQPTATKGSPACFSPVPVGAGLSLPRSLFSGEPIVRDEEDEGDSWDMKWGQGAWWKGRMGLPCWMREHSWGHRSPSTFESHMGSVPMMDSFSWLQLTPPFLPLALIWYGSGAHSSFFLWLVGISSADIYRVPVGSLLFFITFCLCLLKSFLLLLSPFP